MLKFLVLLLLFMAITRDSPKSDDQKIETLVRQTSRWATASLQDTNVYIKNLHANYAQGYIMALRSIYSEKEIFENSGVDIRKLSEVISETQNDALVSLAKVCPEGRPKNEFLSRIAKQS